MCMSHDCSEKLGDTRAFCCIFAIESQPRVPVFGKCSRMIFGVQKIFCTSVTGRSVAKVLSLADLPTPLFNFSKIPNFRHFTRVLLWFPCVRDTSRRFSALSHLFIMTTFLCPERIESPVISQFYNVVIPTAPLLRPNFLGPTDVVLTGLHCIRRYIFTTPNLTECNIFPV